MEILNKYIYDPAVDLLGRGGFATVYKAFDKVLEIPVALKFFQSNDQSGKYTIINEIRRAIILSHPNIVRYYGVETMVNRNVHGQEEEVQIGVMEFVQEGQMKTYLAKNPVSFQELNKLFLDTLEGLKYLHAQGIIHRDIKPQNILLGRDKQNKLLAKISDFGISKSGDSDQASASVLLGTIEYMAPEQFNPEKYGINKTISYNVDVWAFGVTAYYLLKGELLFGNRSGDTSAAHLINKIVSVEGLDEKLNSVQEPYKSLLKKCIVPDAKIRTGNIDELIAIMKPHVGGAEGEKMILHEAQSSNASSDETVAIQSSNASDETKVIQVPDQKKTASTNNKKSVDHVAAEIPQSSVVSTKKSKLPLVLGAVFIVVIVIGILFFKGVIGGEDSVQMAIKEKEDKGKQLVKDYILNQMVNVTGGSFVFGGAPRTDVDKAAQNVEQTITLPPFKASKMEVTRYLWNTVMDDKKYPDAMDQNAPGANLPANHVSWEDARRFTVAMNMLLAKNGEVGSGSFALPTQVQWEYVCLNEYSGDYKIDDVSWNLNNSGNAVHPVGTKKAGKLGTHDMLGNVFEWCEEMIDMQIEGQQIQARVIRGGDYKNMIALLDPKVRNVDLPATRNDIIGFRLVLNESK